MTKPAQRKPPKPSDERGDFRSMYSVLFDSPEYEDLSLAASHLLVTVKHSLGPAGIGVLEVATLQRRAKLTDPHLFAAARDELLRGDWIRVQHRVWWLRNGLRFEPSMSSTNENHVRGVQRFLNGLPKLAIANHFAAYYKRLGWDLNEPFPGTHGNGIGMGSGSHGDPIENPSPWVIPSGSHSDPTAITEPLTLTEPLTEPLTLTESDSETESESRAREGSASPQVNGGHPDFDGYLPTEDQVERALELRVDIGVALRKWRANRKAHGHTPINLAADFDGWLENEPGFHRAPHQLSVVPSSPVDHGIVKQYEPAPPPEPDLPPLTAEQLAEGRRIAGLERPPPGVVPADVQAERERKLALVAEADGTKAKP